MLVVLTWSFSLPDTSRSSTYYKIRTSPSEVNHSSNHFRACPKRLGDSVNPWGRWVHLNCCFLFVSGSSHSKENQSQHSSARRHVQKASFKSMIVIQACSLGIWLRRLYGFGTTGCLAIVFLLTSLRSCTNLYCPSAFLTVSMGVLCGDIHGSKILPCNSCSITRASHLLPSRDIGYCFTHMGEVSFCIVIVIGRMFNNPHCPPSAHTLGSIASMSPWVNFMICTITLPSFGTNPTPVWTCRSAP